MSDGWRGPVQAVVTTRRRETMTIIRSEHVKKTISNNTWLHNSRGEWYVIAQAVLFFALLFAPTLDGFIGGQVATIAGGFLCAVGLGFIVLGTVGLGRR